MTKTRSLRTFSSADYLEGVFRLAEEMVMDKRDRDDLGARYQQARIMAGLTQLELGGKLGYTERTVGAYERGEVQEGLRPAREWAKATGVRYEWLVTGDGDQLLGEDGDRLGRIEVLIEGLLEEIRALRAADESRSAEG